MEPNHDEMMTDRFSPWCDWNGQRFHPSSEETIVQSRLRTLRPRFSQSLG